MVKFAIYTFLGFIMESVYVSILERKIYFSGLLKGPFIPIYGFGALLILKTVPYYQNNFDTFFYSLICCTVLEYLTHYFLSKDSNIQIWNYSKISHNYSGRICMFYSLMWGILGIVLVNYIDPFINSILIHLNYNFLNVIALIYVLIIMYQFYNYRYNNH
ncbi:putative ABC transporter permease [Thomasclavelia saccharogumia]|uniref:putative ABC transporter permease n=1 Tax=Thomasclavelia saccharogumia TaxID=341225 RepID=UPI0004796805|nr:putative ABC transporter permease [Thomasclavelia saccharogumia]